MKRFSKLIAHLAIAGATPLMPFMVSAGVTNVGVIKTSSSIDFTPKQFSFGNKFSMYIDEYTEDTNGYDIKTTFTIYDGDFKVIKTFTTPEYPKVSFNDQWGSHIRYAKPESMCIFDDNGNESQYFYLTQTLFNNDEAYEWVEPKLSVIDTESGKDCSTSGFRVLSDNGKVVIDEDFDIEENIGSVYIDDLNIIPTERGVYMLCKVGTSNDGNIRLIYKIDPESSSVKQVAVHRNIRVNPSAPHRGTAVNVDLGEPIGNNAKLSVVNMSGRTVVTQNLTPGSTEAVIETYRFEPGVYVVVLNNGETELETTKIVVR